MKLCEYVNNFISLNTLNNQARIGKIKCGFKKNEGLKYLIDTMFFKGDIGNYLFFSVMKEAHDPIYKIFGEHYENEEKIDEYIKTYKMIPMMLKIDTDYITGIELKEILSMLHAEKHLHLPKHIYLYWL